MLPVIGHPVIKIVRDCYVCKLTGKTMVPLSKVFEKSRAMTLVRKTYIQTMVSAAET